MRGWSRRISTSGGIEVPLVPEPSGVRAATSSTLVNGVVVASVPISVEAAQHDRERQLLATHAAPSDFERRFLDDVLTTAGVSQADLRTAGPLITPFGAPPYAALLLSQLDYSIAPVRLILLSSIRSIVLHGVNVAFDNCDSFSPKIKCTTPAQLQCTFGHSSWWLHSLAAHSRRCFRGSDCPPTTTIVDPKYALSISCLLISDMCNCMYILIDSKLVTLYIGRS